MNVAGKRSARTPVSDYDVTVHGVHNYRNPIDRLFFRECEAFVDGLVSRS